MEKISRNSKKRSKILNILKKGGLMTVNQIWDKIKEIDKATVYRNIEKFVEEDIIKEVRIKKGESSYEYIDSSHQHLICEDCDEVYHVDIEEDKLKEFILKNAPDLKDYDINSIELNIRGICKNKS